MSCIDSERGSVSDQWLESSGRTENIAEQQSPFFNGIK
jgi:hypothetical protein